MSEVTRVQLYYEDDFGAEHAAFIVRDEPEGDYVRHEDHIAAVTAERAKVAELERLLHEARRDVAIMRGYTDWDAMVRAGQGCDEEKARRHAEIVSEALKDPSHE